MTLNKFLSALNECSGLNIIFQLTDKCVMSCRYCFAKGAHSGKTDTFSDEVLEEAIRQAFGTRHNSIVFEWTGGEALLVGKSFFEKVKFYQEKYATKPYANHVQTSCFLYDEELINYLINNNFRLSTTIDGTKEVHNANRPANRTLNSYDTVIENRQKILNKGASCGFIATVTKNNLGHEQEILDCFRKLGINSFHSNPYIYYSKNKVKDEALALSPEDFARYFIAEFNAWYDSGQQYPIPMTIDYMLECLRRKDPSHNTLCTYGGRCLTNFIAIVPNGDAYVCPKFTGSGNMMLGNILKCCINDLLSPDAPIMHRIIEERLSAFAKCEKENCGFAYICNGGCPYHSFIASEGENVSEKDYLCEGKQLLLNYLKGVLKPIES